MANPLIKVLVTVSGGVAEVATDSPSLVDVVVVDYDDAEAGDGDAGDATFQDGKRVTDMLSHDELFYVI